MEEVENGSKLIKKKYKVSKRRKKGGKGEMHNKEEHFGKILQILKILNYSLLNSLRTCFDKCLDKNVDILGIWTQFLTYKMRDKGETKGYTMI